MFFVPNYNALDDARKARLEFARALGAYIDLVALERNNGIGVRQAMEAAAEVGDSWVFTRLSEELTRSRWSGLPPWDALHTLAEELGLPELDDFADIMRLSGEEGASVYATLRARSASMRTAMLNDEIAQANAVGERMTHPRISARRDLHGAAGRALVASHVHGLVTWKDTTQGGTQC